MNAWARRVLIGSAFLIIALIAAVVLFSISISDEIRTINDDRQDYLVEILDSVEMEFSPFVQLVSTASVFAGRVELNPADHEAFLELIFSSSNSALLYGMGIWYEPYQFNEQQRWYGPYIRFDDPRGGPYSITYEWQIPEYDYHRTDWYQRLLYVDRGEIAITPPFFDTDYTYITLGTPFFRDGRKAGVISADFIFPLLEQFFSSRDLSGFEGVYLTTAENRLIYTLKEVAGSDTEFFVQDRFYNLNVRKWAVKNGRKFQSFDIESRNGNFMLYSYLDEQTVLRQVIYSRRSFIIAFLVSWLVLLVSFLLYLRYARQRRKNTELNEENIMLREEIRRRETAESQLEFLAYHDMVTRLENLYSFFDSVTPPTGPDDKRQLIQISLDNIRELSFIIEGSIIDRLLIDLSDKMKQVCGSDARLFRGRGFTFFLAVENETGNQAERIAGLLSDEFSKIFMLNKRNIKLRFHIGIAPFAAARSLDHIITMAQSTVGDRQNSESGVVSHYNSEIEERKSYLAALDNEMSRGAFVEELELFYQPIINVETRQVAGLEALVRWNSSYFNRLVSPVDFIPTAEENGSIIDLGWFVLKEAFGKLVGELKDSDIFISVNVSPMQFLETGFPEHLEELVQKFGVDKNRLKLEITETSAASAVRYFWQSVEKLINGGFRLAMDDFGTGESSFGRLYTYNFDTLKIDRSLITDIIENPKHQLIFRSILQLGSVLDNNVVAEGVETEAEHELLKSFGLKYAQGYLYSKPRPLDQLLKNIVI